jgi:hydroxymethylpyrimidine/phosphomethylpyrimidine kinase
MNRKDSDEILLARITDAIGHLSRSAHPATFLLGGIRIGFCREGPLQGTDVAAGSITPNRDQGVPAGGQQPPAFGSDMEISRVLITIARFDRQIRAVGVVAFSQDLLESCEGLLYETAGFDSGHTPPGISTMDWGVASCCKDGVPDVIYDRGTHDMSGSLRFLGEEPGEVATKILKAIARIHTTPL